VNSSTNAKWRWQCNLCIFIPIPFCRFPMQKQEREVTWRERNGRISSNFSYPVFPCRWDWETFGGGSIIPRFIWNQ
jgi:hypothetical protein